MRGGRWYDDDEDETHFISTPFLGQLSFREVRIKHDYFLSLKGTTTPTLLIQDPDPSTMADTERLSE